MIYRCEDCGFLFLRVGDVKACPSCEGSCFRHAMPEEAKRLQALLNKEMEDRKGENI